MPFLFRNRIVYTNTELLDYVNRLNGKVMCSTSLYSFKEVNNRKPCWDTVILNKVLIESNLENTKKLIEVLSNDPGLKNVEILYIGDNIFYTIIFCDVFDKLVTTAKEYQDRLDRLGIKCKVNNILNKKIPIPNTYNPRYKCWVIPLEKDDLKDLSYIEDLAKEPRLIDKHGKIKR